MIKHIAIIMDGNCAYDYIRKLCSGLLGVEQFRFIRAQGLDIYGNDPEKILSDAIEKMYKSLSLS